MSSPKLPEPSFSLDKNACFFYSMAMGYIFNHSDTLKYEEHLKQPKNRCIAALEHELMFRMLRPLRGKRILDIGCGTGAGLVPFLNAGLDMTGLDPSSHMLDIASKTLGHRSELYRGIAEDLPFEDNSFHYACLTKTLEFVEDPRKAISEACRVAKDKVFIGFVNRHSLKASGMRIKRFFVRTWYDHARFFGIWELRTMIRSLSGNMPISWRTVCTLPNPSGMISRKIENSKLTQFSPFGAYGGMVITLLPRYRTIPLELPRQADCAEETVAGLAKIKRRPTKDGSLSV